MRPEVGMCSDAKEKEAVLEIADGGDSLHRGADVLYFGPQSIATRFIGCVVAWLGSGIRSSAKYDLS